MTALGSGVDGMVRRLQTEYDTAGRAARFTSLTEDKAVSEITYAESSGVFTATATTTTAHGFYTGQSVLVSGANQAAYNGTFVVTKVGEIKVTRAFTAYRPPCRIGAMPRIARRAPGGLVYHALNRANGRLRLFKKDQDFTAFEQVLLEAHQRVPIRILDWCVMPNHWHFVLWPEHDGQLTQFLRWLTLTHTQRWKHAHDAVGHGHLYRGRFKSFPVEQDGHLLSVLRYVQRNPLRAALVRRAEQWRWGGCFARLDRTHALHPLLAEWPVDRPRRWLDLVNRPQTADEEAAVKAHIERGRPYGRADWAHRTAKALGLEQSFRPRGRPPGWRKQVLPTGGTDNGLRHL